MKKFSIFLIIALIILLVGQTIYFAKKRKIANEENYTIYYTENEINAIHNNTEIRDIENLEGIIEKYKITMGYNAIQLSIYDFTSGEINRIYDWIKDDLTEDYEAIYNANKDVAEEMQIKNAEDFVGIALQLKSIDYDITFSIKSLKIDKDLTYKTEDGNYIETKLTISYTNDKTLDLKIKIPIDMEDEKIYYSDYDYLTSLYNQYKGTVKKEDLKVVINNIADSAADILENTRLKTDNKVKSEYDNNSKYLTDLKIQSADDFYSIVNAIKGVTESEIKETPVIVIDETTYKEENGYAIVELKFKYEKNSFTLKIYLAMDEKTPAIIVKA